MQITLAQRNIDLCWRTVIVNVIIVPFFAFVTTHWPRDGPGQRSKFPSKCNFYLSRHNYKWIVLNCICRKQPLLLPTASREMDWSRSTADLWTRLSPLSSVRRYVPWSGGGVFPLCLFFNFHMFWLVRILHCRQGSHLCRKPAYGCKTKPLVCISLGFVHFLFTKLGLVCGLENALGPSCSHCWGQVPSTFNQSWDNRYG